MGLRRAFAGQAWPAEAPGEWARALKAIVLGRPTRGITRPSLRTPRELEHASLSPCFCAGCQHFSLDSHRRNLKQGRGQGETAAWPDFGQKLELRQERHRGSPLAYVKPISLLTELADLLGGWFYKDGTPDGVRNCRLGSAKTRTRKFPGFVARDSATLGK